MKREETTDRVRHNHTKRSLMVYPRASPVSKRFDHITPEAFYTTKKKDQSKHPAIILGNLLYMSGS